LIRAPRGLEGVIVDTTTISIGDPDGRLIYRGYDIGELAEKSGFEESAYLILRGRLPNAAELSDFSRRLVAERNITPELEDILAKLPSNAHPMDIARTGISYLGMADPDLDDPSYEANLRKAIRIVAKTPLVISAGYRLSRGVKPVKADMSLNHAANFLYMLTGKKEDEFAVRVFELTLILYMDHDFNASAFTTRAVASTGSDIYSAITAAFAALKGPLHGGANEAVMHMLKDIGEPSRTVQWVQEALAKKQKVAGFGHRVYKRVDPRVPIAKPYLAELCKKRRDTKWVEFLNILEDIMTKEKGLPPNIDLYTGPVYHLLGIPAELYTPIFAAARVVGWSAHFIEQVQNNRIIRPKAEYIGPKGLRYVPISERA